MRPHDSRRLAGIGEPLPQQQRNSTLHIDATFWSFVQSKLSVNDYCRKMKGFTDSLIDLGIDVTDHVLVLNALMG
jgi:hypothetical protein